MRTSGSDLLSAIAGSEISTFANTPAVIQPGMVAWDYGQLQRHLHHLGKQLQAAGLGLNDTIAVAMPDGAACLVTQLGVMNVCACAPLNPLLTVSELRHDLVELGASALVCCPDLIAGLQLTRELRITAILASVKDGECVWEVSAPGPRLFTTPPTAKPNAGAAILLHTSATTGRRKIVPLSRANLRAACRNTSQSLQLTSQDRLLVMARLFHAQGILSALSQWSCGGTVLVSNTFEPAVFTRLLTGLEPTWYTCGPTLHQAMLSELQKQPQPTPHCLRFIRSGGNTLPPELKAALEQYLGVPMLDMYGLSETGAVAAVSLDPSGPGGWRSVGPEICILSSDGKPLGHGEEGEIAVRGASVMTGYWNDDDANREAFWPSASGRPADAWFRTGDLGRLNANGILTLSGRLKEIINRGGQKIVPTEVDQVLRRHPAVKAVAAFAIPHPSLGEDIACAVVLHEGASLTESELQAFARKSLVRYKVPRRIHFLPALPHGATGKPQRLVLRERLGARPAAEPGASAFSTEHTLTRSEKTIAALWAGLLASSEIGLEDDFFRLGGDSLGAISMLSEVEILLQMPLPPEATERFFESPTLKTLSHLLGSPLIAQEKGSHNLRLYPLLGDGPGVEAFLIPADDEEGWYFRLLSRHLGEHRPLWMLRPENGLYAPGPNQIEATAARAVELIRERRPHGPYVVGGFCLGGVIAYETACLLELAGETVALVLFDTPTPGEPHLLYAWKQYVQQWMALLRTARRGARARRRMIAFPRLLFRRLLWLILRQLKERGRLSADSSMLSWMRREAEHDYFPPYRPPPSHVPILHFLMAEGREPLRQSSAQSWRHISFAETLVVRLPGSHHSLFRETNLAPITQAIEHWLPLQLKTGMTD